MSEVISAFYIMLCFALVFQMPVLIIYIDNTRLFLRNTDTENKPVLSRTILTSYIYIYIAQKVLIRENNFPIS